MKIGIGNLVSIIFLILAVLYIVYTSVRYEEIKKEIQKNGKFNIAIIDDEFIGKQSMRSFAYSFNFNKKKYYVKVDVSVIYFNQHKINDTIIIKFLPCEPEKSIIIEYEEYKSCYGIPPLKGWIKLPDCTDKSFLSNEKSNNSDIEDNKEFKNKPLSFSSDRESRYHVNKERVKQKQTEIIWILLALGICFIVVVIMTKRNND